MNADVIIGVRLVMGAFCYFVYRATASVVQPRRGGRGGLGLDVPGLIDWPEREREVSR